MGLLVAAWARTMPRIPNALPFFAFSCLLRTARARMYIRPAAM